MILTDVIVHTSKASRASVCGVLWTGVCGDSTFRPHVRSYFSGVSASTCTLIHELPLLVSPSLPFLRLEHASAVCICTNAGIYVVCSMYVCVYVCTKMCFVYLG